MSADPNNLAENNNEPQEGNNEEIFGDEGVVGNKNDQDEPLEKNPNERLFQPQRSRKPQNLRPPDEVVNPDYRKPQGFESLLGKVGSATDYLAGRFQLGNIGNLSIPSFNPVGFIPRISLRSIDNCGNDINSGISGTLYTVASGVSQVWNTGFSIIPRISNLYFSAKFLLPTLLPIQSNTQDESSRRDLFKEILITSTGNVPSVHYFSQDAIEDFKICVSIRKLNTHMTQAAMEAEKNDRTYTTIVGWQQKVFSPRELTMYKHKTKISSSKSANRLQIDNEYSSKVENLFEKLNHSPYDDEFDVYVQKECLREGFSTEKLLRQLKGNRSVVNNSDTEKETLNNKKEQETGSQTNRNSKRKPFSPLRKWNFDFFGKGASSASGNTENDNVDEKWAENGENCLFDHIIFTYTSKDGYQFDSIQEAIKCSSASNVPVQRSNSNDSVTSNEEAANTLLNNKSQQSDNKQQQTSKDYQYLQDRKQMAIMASFGEFTKDGKKWKGEEYCLCVVNAFGDGSIVMKPGMSEMNDDDIDAINEIDETEDTKSDQVDKFIQEINKREREKRKVIRKRPKKYLFRTENNEVYEYTINLFNDTKKNQKISKMRSDILQKLNERSEIMRKNLVGIDFVKPPYDPQTTRLHLFGEIESVHGLKEERKICVNYWLNYPSTYEIDQKSVEKETSSNKNGASNHSLTALKGRTQFSTPIWKKLGFKSNFFDNFQTKYETSLRKDEVFNSNTQQKFKQFNHNNENDENNSNNPSILENFLQNKKDDDKDLGKDRESFNIFNFPFAFHLLSKKSTPPFPKIFFKISSFDWLGRYRVEGYSYCDIPIKPGSYAKVLNIWKPKESIRENLRSFFLGGSPELKDITYAAVPSDFHGTFLNKYGFETVGTGYINVNLNVAIQKQSLQQS